MQYGKQRPPLRFRLSFVFLFVIASLIGCFVMYMKSEEGDPLMNQTDVPKVINIVAEDVTEAVPDKQVENPVPLSGRAEDGYMKNALFAGDALISGLSEAGLTDSEHILIIDEHTDYSLIKDRTFSAIYLLFSPQDISDDNGRKAFIYDVRKITQKLRSHNRADIYILSVLPLPQGGKDANADIDMINSMLLTFCNEQNIYYIDENTYLKGSDGTLRSSYSRNGQLTEQAYSAVFEMIRTHTAVKEK